MTKSVRRSIVALIALSTIRLSVGASAAAFFPWRVADVSSDDVLMVRAYPSSASSILVGYPSGVILSMTGRCTGNLDLGSIGGLPAWQQRQIVRGQWCEVWLDPYATGEFRNGWVYGRYIAPI